MLAAQEEILGAAPLWTDPGLTGNGIIIASNDTGLDLKHPDFPADAIISTNGVMAYTDNGHGTHTAGSIAGRGLQTPPVNTSGCGNLIEALPTVRGLAWQARLVINNVINGGLTEISDMMRWGIQQGASISANSWGLGGIIEVTTNYDATAVGADVAVRDADPGEAGNQELTMVFSAGNGGPVPSSVITPATSKNSITAGATQNLRCGSYVPPYEDGPDIDRVLELSSRGPSQGRIKPDVVAPGADVLSTQSGDFEASAPWDQDWTGESYTLGTGTSMSCPLVTGAAALFHEAYYRDHALLPSPALTKAALINAARDLGRPREEQGWGRIDIGRTINGPPGGRSNLIEQNHTLRTGDRMTFDCLVFSELPGLRITLVWTDVPGEADADHPLVNDLDLLVTAPDGTVYRGNQIDGAWSIADPPSVSDYDNNVENVFIETPAAGTWSIEVIAVNIPEFPNELDGQDFALVYSGDAAPCIEPPPPTGVTATAIADNRIEIQWNPSTNATNYEILRSRTPGGRPYFPIATVAGDTTSFVDSTVSGSLTYFYVVRVFTGCWSNASEQVIVEATGLCLEKPNFSGLSAIQDLQKTSCSIGLEWAPATSVCTENLTYSIYRSSVADFSPSVTTLIQTGLEETSFSDRGLTPDEEYFYIVQATGATSALSDGNQFIRSISASGPNRIHMLEDGEAGPGDWVMEAASNKDSDTTAWVISSNDSHSDSSAWHCNSEERIKDQALRLGAPLEISDGLKLEFFHRFSLESKRDGGRLEYSTDNGATWFDILESDGFSVPADEARFLEGGYVDTVSGENPVAVAMTWTGKSTGWQRVLVNLQAMSGQAMLLRWRLSTNETKVIGDGWWIDDIRIFSEEECRACFSPAPPAAVSAEARTEGIEITWNPIDGAGEYQLLRSLSPGGPYAQIFSSGIQNSYFDTAVSGGSEYFYVVTVLTDCLSEYSHETKTTARGPCTLAPVFFGLASVNNYEENRCGIDLRWAPAVSQCPGASPAYRIFRSTEANFIPTDTNDTNFLAETIDISFRDANVTDSQPYTYIVRAFDRTNQSSDNNQKPRTTAATGSITALFADDIEQGPDMWTTSLGSSADRQTEPWSISDSNSSSATHSWFVSNEPTVKDQVVQLIDAVLIPAEAKPTLEFEHFYNFETFWDGGRLEYSSDGTQSWHDILASDGQSILANEDRFLEGGYVVALSIGTATNPLAGQRAWTGPVNVWTGVKVDLSDFVGHMIHFRWRTASDDSRNGIGWWIDDIQIVYTAECQAQGPRRPGQRME